MDRFFCFLLRTKSVLRLKNRSRTGKTDDFSSPGAQEVTKIVLLSKGADKTWKYSLHSVSTKGKFFIISVKDMETI